jgi:hypothetical protein
MCACKKSLYLCTNGKPRVTIFKCPNLKHKVSNFSKADLPHVAFLKSLTPGWRRVRYIEIN